MKLAQILFLLVMAVLANSTAGRSAPMFDCWYTGWGGGQLVADQSRLQASAWTSMNTSDPCFQNGAWVEAQAWNDGGTGPDVDEADDVADAYKSDTNQAPYYGIQSAYTTNIYRSNWGDEYIGDGWEVLRQDDAS